MQIVSQWLCYKLTIRIVFKFKVELRDTVQIFDHVSDISFARTSAKQAGVEREWRVTRERRADVLLLAFASYLPHSPKKGKKLVSN